MAENITNLTACLRKVPEMEPLILRSEIGLSVSNAPDLPEGAPIMIGQVVQVIDFAAKEDVEIYLRGKAHATLVELSAPMMKSVAGIDYDI